MNRFMSLGAYMGFHLLKKKRVKDKLAGVFILLFGIPDLHAHIRFRALRRYFQCLERNVEIGAGGVQ